MQCDNSRSTVTLDSQQRSWEHFFSGEGAYVFSNQIPNLESFTRTDPGWVLRDNNYCQWSGIPPERIRSNGPTETAALSEPVVLPDIANSEPGAEGGAGIIFLLAVIAAAGWAFMNKDAKEDPSYHPMADLDTRLPPLRLNPVSAWKEGDPVPAGYKVVDDEEEQTSPVNSVEASAEPVESWGDGYTERNPWLADSVKHYIKTEADIAAARRLQELRGGANVPEIMRRIHPGSAPPYTYLKPPETTGLNRFETRLETSFETGLHTGFETGLGAGFSEPDPREVEMFETNVRPFCPLAVDSGNGTTLEAVRQALKLGKSQNWIVTNLFQISKGNSVYQAAVNIIKGQMTNV